MGAKAPEGTIRNVTVPFLLVTEGLTFFEIPPEFRLLDHLPGVANNLQRSCR